MKGIDFAKSVLGEFAYGNANPDDGYFEKDSKYGNTIKTISKSEEKLLSMLNAEQKELLLTFATAQLRANTISNVGNIYLRLLSWRVNDYGSV